MEPQSLMTLEMWIAILILITAIALFVTEKLRVDIVALLVVVALMLTGLITPSEALAGFSNTSVITIAALFIVGGAVMQTDLAGMIARRILAIAGENQLRLLTVLMVAVALVSGFLSNTGTVAVLLPAVIALARTTGTSASKLLIPLSFASMLGGAATLIGTPPNLIVSDLLRDQGYRAFEFFDFTPVGIIMIVVGIGYMMLVGRRVLPDRRIQAEMDFQPVESPEELLEHYRLPDQLYRVRVRPGSALIDKTVAEAAIRREFDVNILEVLRPEPFRGVMTLGAPREVITPYHPDADMAFAAGDILIVQGAEDAVGRAVAYWNLGIQARDGGDAQRLINSELGIAEVLLPPRSSLLDKTLLDTQFRRIYDLTVLAIERPGSDAQPDLLEATLQPGDILFVQGTWDAILNLKRNARDFVLLSQPEATAGFGLNPQKAPVALAILMGMLLLMVIGITSVVAASLLAAVAMVLTGCLTMDDAYESIDWKSIVLIAGMLPMATALEKVGLVALASQTLTDLTGGAAPVVVMGAMFFLTALFTQLLSNTATTVLVAPIALASALQIGVAPQAFMMAVALASSMAFATPVASPTNTLVMGAGGYRFGDYAKVGIPLIFVMMIVVLIVVPIFWPFYPG